MKARFLFLLVALSSLLVAAFTMACGSSEPTLIPTQASATQRVLVIHSYSDLFTWTRDQNTGITEGLRRAGYTAGQQFQIETFFMDTRLTYTSPEQIKERASDALDMIQDFRPDIIFVTDDNALRDVAVAYNEEHPGATIPAVFSGINVDPSVYAPIQSLDRPGGPITGTLERVPYREVFKLGKRLFPGASKIVILADDSGSSRFVADTFQQDYPGPTENQPLEVLDYILIDTFEKWRKTVQDNQATADIIGILNYHQLRDSTGVIVTPAEVVEWMVENNQVPEMGLVADWAEDGILVSAGNSGHKVGIFAGMVGGSILDGEDPGSIPIVDPKEIDVAYNLERARTLGVTFPAAELDSADAVYNTLGGGN